MGHLPTQADVKIIALVGKIVTKGDRQFKVHSVEGPTWYAFNNDQEETVLDLGLAKIDTMERPVLTLTPSGHKIGSGLSENAFADQVSKGVCLVKSWI